LRTRPSVYEAIFFDQINDRNKGEKHNFISALDFFLKENKRNLLFLIDDENALRGCLNEVKEAFPIMRIWNSFDVILFLYIIGSKSKFPFDIAREALRSLNAEMATDDENMDPRKRQVSPSLKNNLKMNTKKIFPLLVTKLS
jgi:hypothetical protein